MADGTDMMIGLAMLILTFIWSMMNWAKARMDPEQREKLNPYKIGPTMVVAIVTVGLVYFGGFTSPEVDEILRPLAPFVMLIVNTLIAMYFKKKGINDNGSGGEPPAPTPPASTPTSAAPPTTQPDGGWVTSSMTNNEPAFRFMPQPVQAASSPREREPLALMH